MKYSDMTDEQKKAYKQKQVENQRIARQRAKENTLELTIVNAPQELIDAVIKALEGK